MFAKPDEVRPRRVRRRLKAIASLMVGVAAGTFLTCQRQVAKPVKKDAPQPITVDVPAPDESPKEAADASVRPDALVPRAEPKKDASVDRREHRKGMPVPDNLLE